MHDSNIIFLHGWLFDRRIWHDLDKLFHNKFNVLMHDLPGYGENKVLGINSQQYCDNIFREAEENTTIVGYSYGGILALKSFQDYSLNINKVILINSNLDITNYTNKILNIKSINALKNSLLNNKSESLKKFMYECVKKSKYNKTEFSKLIKMFSSDTLPNTEILLENLDDLIIPIHTNSGFNRQRDILLINTDEDNFINSKSEYRINNKIIKNERILGLGHIPFISGNNQIYNSINKFVKN